MKSPCSRLLFFEKFLIIAKISLVTISLVRLSISSSFSLGRSYVSRNLSISSIRRIYREKI